MDRSTLNARIGVARIDALQSVYLTYPRKGKTTDRLWLFRLLCWANVKTDLAFIWAYRALAKANRSRRINNPTPGGNRD